MRGLRFACQAIASASRLDPSIPGKRCARTSDVPEQHRDGSSAYSSHALAWCSTRSALVSLWRRISFEPVAPLLQRLGLVWLAS